MGFIVSNDNSSLFSVPPTISVNGTLSYTPAANASGSAVVTVRLQDNGGVSNGGADTSVPQTFTITVTPVNDAPIKTVPAPQTTRRNRDIVFSPASGNQISIADIDAGSAVVRVTLTATNGTLTLFSTTGLTFLAGDGNRDATMTFEGSIAAINLAMTGMVFRPRPGYIGPAGLSITTSDLGQFPSPPLSDTDSLMITVVP